MSLHIALLSSACALLFAVATPAHAEFQLSAYGGANWNFDSNVKTQKGAVSDSRDVSWKGKPFEAPPYWGVRGTYWLDKQSPWGVALDFTHQKAYGDLDFAADPVYDTLEFTDGNNIVTLNAMYRVQQPKSNWSYYVGGGPGIAIPHVEVALDGISGRTFEYQITGIAAQVLAGTQYKFTDHIAGFTEAKLAYTHINADLNGGGSTKTDIWSPNALVGVAYIF